MNSHPIYELLQEIGSGDFATVYRARDLSLRRYVAIKELHEKYRQDPRQLEHFWEEAQFLANLQHDNIVQVHGVDKQHGWIIMELMRASLDAKIAEGRMPPETVRGVLRQGLQALECLHGRGKLHGAVKPANLLINDLGRVKLSDSAGVPPDGEIHRPTGTSKYLAPELLNTRFGPVGFGVDLYSMGFTALELLVGSGFDAHFKGVVSDDSNPEMAWMRWHVSEQEPLPQIRQLVPGVPEDLAKVLERLLTKPVASRYASAAAALEDLEDRPIPLVELPSAATSSTRTRQKEGEAGEWIAGAPPSSPPRPLPPSPSAPHRPKNRAEPKQAKAAVDGPAPWSREWINRRIEKPWVLYPLCAVILLIPLIFAMLPEKGKVTDTGSKSDSSLAKPKKKPPLAQAPKKKSKKKPVAIPPEEPELVVDFPLTLKGHKNWVQAVAFWGRDRVVSCGDDFSIRIWHLADKDQCLHTIEEAHGANRMVFDIAVVPGGDIAASAGEDGLVRLWDLKTYKNVGKLEAHKGPVLCVAFSPDGKRLLSGGEDGTVRVWDVERPTSGPISSLEGHSDKVMCVAYCGDGVHAVSGSKDLTVRLWDVEKGQQEHVFLGHKDTVEGVACSPRDINPPLAVSASDDGTVRVWDLKSKLELNPAYPEGGWAHCVAISPDGKTALSAGNDKKIHVWTVADRKDIKSAMGDENGHKGLIEGVAFEPVEGRLAVSCGHDFTVIVWDLGF